MGCFMEFIVAYFFLLVVLFGIFTFLSYGPPPDDMEIFQYAGFWQRLGAYMLDSTLLSIGTFVVAFIYALSEGGPVQGVQDQVPRVSGAILMMFIYPTYYAVFESSEFRGTPGKLIMGIQVVNNSGQGISLGQAYLRWFCILFNYLTLYFGYLVAAVTRRKVALHDVLAKTFVIQTPQSKQNKQTAHFLAGNMSANDAGPGQDTQPIYDPRF